MKHKICPNKSFGNSYLHVMITTTVAEDARKNKVDGGVFAHKIMNLKLKYCLQFYTTTNYVTPFQLRRLPGCNSERSCRWIAQHNQQFDVAVSPPFFPLLASPHFLTLTPFWKFCLNLVWGAMFWFVPCVFLKVYKTRRLSIDLISKIVLRPMVRRKNAVVLL